MTQSVIKKFTPQIHIQGVQYLKTVAKILEFYVYEGICQLQHTLKVITHYTFNTNHLLSAPITHELHSLMPPYATVQ